MTDYLLPFRHQPWDHPRPGVAQKVFVTGPDRIRLLRFDAGLQEEEWCTSGHTGYVLQGELTISFAGSLHTFTAGDGLFIPPGSDHRHRVQLPDGHSATLVLFEKS